MTKPMSLTANPELHRTIGIELDQLQLSMTGLMNDLRQHKDEVNRVIKANQMDEYAGLIPALETIEDNFQEAVTYVSNACDDAVTFFTMISK